MITQKKYDKLKAMLIAQRKKNRLNESSVIDPTTEAAVKQAASRNGIKYIKTKPFTRYPVWGNVKEVYIIKNKFGITAQINNDPESDSLMIMIESPGTQYWWSPMGWARDPQIKKTNIMKAMAVFSNLKQNESDVSRAQRAKDRQNEISRRANIKKTKVSPSQINNIAKLLFKKINERYADTTDDPSSKIDTKYLQQLAAAYKKDVANGARNMYDYNVEDTTEFIVNGDLYGQSSVGEDWIIGNQEMDNGKDEVEELQNVFDLLQKIFAEYNIN